MKICLEVIQCNRQITIIPENFTGKYYYAVSVDGKREFISYRPYKTIQSARKAAVLILGKLGYERDLTPGADTKPCQP